MLLIFRRRRCHTHRCVFRLPMPPPNHLCGALVYDAQFNVSQCACCVVIVMISCLPWKSNPHLVGSFVRCAAMMPAAGFTPPALTPTCNATASAGGLVRLFFKIPTEAELFFFFFLPGWRLLRRLFGGCLLRKLGRAETRRSCFGRIFQLKSMRRHTHTHARAHTHASVGIHDV